MDLFNILYKIIIFQKKIENSIESEVVGLVDHCNSVKVLFEFL